MITLKGEVEGTRGECSPLAASLEIERRSGQVVALFLAVLEEFVGDLCIAASNLDEIVQRADRTTAATV